MPLENGYYYEDYIKGAGTRYAVDEILYQGKTAFQDVLIFTNPVYGKVLVLDDVVQTSTFDEFIYHEMLTHMPMFAVENPGKVLIIGGGDGGMLREVLKHPETQATMIDIDGELVDLCREHMPEIPQDAYDNPRATYMSGDGFAFVKETDETFDVIIVDSTDPHGGPGDVLYSQDFFETCKARLNPGGVTVIQSGAPLFEKKRVKDLNATMGEVFADMRLYLCSSPCYFGSLFSFGWGSDDPGVRQTPVEVVQQRYKAAGFETRYYTPKMHASAFSLPKLVRDLFTA